MQARVVWSTNLTTEEQNRQLIFVMHYFGQALMLLQKLVYLTADWLIHDVYVYTHAHTPSVHLKSCTIRSPLDVPRRCEWPLTIADCLNASCRKGCLYLLMLTRHYAYNSAHLLGKIKIFIARSHFFAREIKCLLSSLSKEINKVTFWLMSPMCLKPKVDQTLDNFSEILIHARLSE